MKEPDERRNEGSVAVELHVTLNGSCRGDGTLAHPFGTIQQARDALREIRRMCPEKLRSGATVWVHGGTCHLAQPLIFDEQDSGTPEGPIAYRVPERQEAKLSGGVPVGGWNKITDERILSRLEPQAREKIRQTDLRAAGIEDFGRMESANNWAQSDAGLELFYRGRPMTLARYPNDGYMHIEEVLVEDGHSIHGCKGSKVGKFKYRDEANRPARWVGERDIMLHGYWFWDWADQRIRLAAFDADRREMTLDDTQPHAYGYRAGQWFYAYNLLCELDSPGEWYLERKTGILYFWPPGESHIRDGEAVVSVTRDPVRFNNVSHLIFRGFVIEASRGTAVRIEGGEKVEVIACAIRNIGGYAVWVEGGTGHRVVGCDVYGTGDGGIVLHGGDRRTLKPGRHEAVNNHIHHIGRWNPLYKTGIQLTGVGNRAAHNRIHDVPHVAIGFTGNDHLVEYNEIYRAVQQANDAGMIYTTGAHPEEWTMRGHVIRHNFLHHSKGFRGLGCQGVYLDDMFSSAAIVGNIFWEIPRAILIGGGRDNVVANNIFVGCRKAVHIDARATGWAGSTVPELIRLLDAVPYREEPWASKYPELVNILQDEPALPKGNVIERNIFSNADWDEIEDKARPVVKVGENLVAEDPGFVNPGVPNSGLTDESPAWKMGFQRIPTERIGLIADGIRKTVPPPG